jgi:hypothetical protein
MKLFKILGQIADDTFKKKNEAGELKWSRTSLTMGVCTFTFIGFAIVDFIMNGFKINFPVWVTLVSVAVTGKVLDSVSTKISK